MENNGKSEGVVNSTRKEWNNLARNADLKNPKEVKAHRENSKLSQLSTAVFQNLGNSLT
jgi:hypothetical protein